ncbi:MAG: ATP-binding protein [Thermodesulfobacterium sp.]|nr:ATP-binding protein [Thermodesulfobacterium sp.]
MKIRLILWIVVIFSSFLLILFSVLNYRSFKLIIERSLQIQATTVSATLESLLPNLNLKKLSSERSPFLSELILNEKWEGIAYVALYDEEGKIVLHSNPELIGKKEILSQKEKFPSFKYLKLKTLEEVLVGDSLLKIEGKTYLLRVALHIAPVERSLKMAQFHFTLEFLSSFLILFLGAVAHLLLRKIERVQAKVKELENLAFLSQVLSHEIRNPLASIKGFSQYLKEKMENSVFREYLHLIEKESLRIEKLMGELSVLSEFPKPNFVKINLKTFLDEVILPFKNNYSEIIFNLKISEDEVWIVSDRDKLKQIMENLIQNAVDAVLESEKSVKKIEVEVFREKSFLVLGIKDNGVGMEVEVLKKMAEPFFTTKVRGMGLGFFIVKKLCEELKINYKIESKRGEGTTVWLTFSE